MPFLLVIHLRSGQSGLAQSGLAQTDVNVDALSDALGDGGVTGWDWLRAGIILVAAFVVSWTVKTVVRRLVERHADAAVADLLGRVGGVVVALFGLVYALEQLDVRVGPLLGALGIVGIALAFALKDILENFVAGVLLQVRRPFSYGDQIRSDDIEGTVSSIDARSVTVVTPDGETVYIPNSQVITSPIVNHTSRGMRRSTIELGVAYGSDLARVRPTLERAVAACEAVESQPSAEVLVTGFGDSSIDLAVRFWHGPTIADQWRAVDEVGVALDQACKEADIEIPFPQRVLRLGSDPATIRELWR